MGAETGRKKYEGTVGGDGTILCDSCAAVGITKAYLIGHLKWMTSMACRLYLNKAIKK